MAELVKNPPAVRETPVQFLGREDPMDVWYLDFLRIFSKTNLRTQEAGTKE